MKEAGMKSQDIVVLLKLVSLYEEADQPSLTPFPRDAHSKLVPLQKRADRPGLTPFPGDDPFSVRNLEMSLGISKSEISASIKRSLDAGLASKDREYNRPRPNRRNLFEFLAHGLKFVFPAKVGSMQRGIPTGFAAPVLEGRLISAGSTIYVWPYAEGREMGQSVEPLFKSVPAAVQRDQRLYEYLALVDAIRLGNQREAKLAEEMLSERIVKK